MPSNAQADTCLPNRVQSGPDALARGQLVRLRTRLWLVDDVEPSAGNGTAVRLSCVDDDAQGQSLEVIWELELDGEILDSEAWASIGQRGFDPPRHFAAYLHTLRWNCVTATDPRLFQAPFRAGIRIDPYQLEPLRKALQLPRVNLFIADDVGLGKTIEAGLIATELLLRRRVREIVVACPPSMLDQWRDELDSRFGLNFEILNREYVERIRRERGYATNPWTTFPRFLVSHWLLIDETYAAPMRTWLDNIRPGSLLIFDEAHHAAPSSGAKYAIDSKITRAIRDLASRFEHRLFLSATPHNGHSNSFSALLELLDDHRFMRGVPVLKSNLDAVMVRRLKDDVREVVGGFPEREVVQVDLSDLPINAPELVLAKLLDDYREVRSRRYRDATKREQAHGVLILSTLQQRLFSSFEAFHRTLGAHRRAMERVWANEQCATRSASLAPERLTAGYSSDDDRAQLDPEQQEGEAEHALEQATLATAGDLTLADSARERALIEEMAQIAELHRRQADARVSHLVRWMQQHMCPGAHLPGQPCPQPGASWSDLRVIIFTEYEDTARHLRSMLEAAIAGTDRAEARIETFHGPTPQDKREAIKHAFNESPARHPVRILIATDAAREGLNLQAYCWNLFHFDLPWNPSRLEQRNGRIDRKLQPCDNVFCHYFVYTQRPEDRVLRALVRKTETIRLELGSLSEVIEKRLRAGIKRADAEAMARDIEGLEEDPEKRTAREQELEDAAQERQGKLRGEIDTLRNRITDARRWIGLDEAQLRDALCCSLELMNVESLQAQPSPGGEPTRFTFPNLATRHGADATWAATLDTLRAVPEDGKRSFQWRRESPIRPVVFEPPSGLDEDVVQLHLSHRVVQRLLSRFQAQGFIYHDLSRACLTQTSDAIPRVVLLGRLSIYGTGAARLHEELLTVTARWTEPGARKGPLVPYSRDAEAKTMVLLEESLRPDAIRSVRDDVARRLQAAIATDIQQLLPHLETRGTEAKADAEKRLADRGRIEADALTKILDDQRTRVLQRLARYEAGVPELKALVAQLNDSERRQLESNHKYWRKWLANVDGDLEREPKRITEFYRTASHRIEPIGLAYLWPATG